MKNRAIISLFFCALVSQANAGAPTPATALRTAPPQIRSDRAYIFLRMNFLKSGIASIAPVLLKIPSDDDLRSYNSAKALSFQSHQKALISQYKKGGSKGPLPSIENYQFTYEDAQNVFGIFWNKSLEDNGEFRSFLIETYPGDYIFYGAQTSTGIQLTSCNCLGTLKFHAESGVITDLGTLLMARADFTSDYPELRSETGFGPALNPVFFVVSQAIRPAKSDTPLPSGLQSSPRHMAEYHAVGPFIEPGAVVVNRFAPLPSVLGYQGGKVIDEKTGKTLELTLTH